ncbi:MAG: hypothetical protein LUC39_05325 [Clostridiales bacterium]|nr:hypothetical protein [Clostridiales bacterium]
MAFPFWPVCSCGYGEGFDTISGGGKIAQAQYLAEENNGKKYQKKNKKGLTNGKTARIITITFNENKVLRPLAQREMYITAYRLQEKIFGKPKKVLDKPSGS